MTQFRLALMTALGAAIVALGPTADAQSPSPISASSAAWEANVVPCRAAVAAAFSPRRDLTFLDRYIAAQGLSATDANVQRVICTAYALGAFDMAEGRIVELDPN